MECQALRLRAEGGSLLYPPAALGSDVLSDTQRSHHTHRVVPFFLVLATGASPPPLSPPRSSSLVQLRATPLPARWVPLSIGLGALCLRCAQAELGSPIASVIFLSASGFLVYGVVTLINTMLHEPPRLWPAVLFFSLTGVLYISWQLLLVIVSLSKICTGTDGGWEVTVRSATQPSAGASDAPANPSSSSPPAVQVDASRSVHTSPMSHSSPIGAVFSDRGGVRSFPELDTLALGATGGGGEGGWTYARLNDSAQEGTPAASLSSNPSDSPPRRVPSAGTMI